MLGGILMKARKTAHPCVCTRMQSQFHVGGGGGGLHLPCLPPLPFYMNLCSYLYLRTCRDPRRYERCNMFGHFIGDVYLVYINQLLIHMYVPPITSADFVF